MLKEWRTIQLFLTKNGIAEVELETFNQKKIRCSCKTSKPWAKCSHIKYVREQMKKSIDGNSYSISVPEDVDDDEAMDAIGDPYSFREFVIKHGKVLVID
jgi:hypothetical protein